MVYCLVGLWSHTTENCWETLPLNTLVYVVEGIWHYPLNLQRAWESAGGLGSARRSWPYAASERLHMPPALDTHPPAVMETACMRQSLKFLASPKIHLAGSKRFSYFCWREEDGDKRRCNRLCSVLLKLNLCDRWTLELFKIMWVYIETSNWLMSVYKVGAKMWGHGWVLVAGWLSRMQCKVFSMLGAGPRQF